MPWYPLLIDAPCFRKYESEPRYQAAVAAIEERQRALREELPETLRSFEEDTSWRIGQPGS